MRNLKNKVSSLNLKSCSALTIATLFALTLHFATNTAIADGHPDAKKLLEMIEKQQKELDALKKHLWRPRLHKPLQVAPAVCRMLFPRTS